jgi:hypothetical protein
MFWFVSVVYYGASQPHFQNVVLRDLHPLSWLLESRKIALKDRANIIFYEEIAEELYERMYGEFGGN